MYSSESGVGGSGVGKGRPVIEQEFNPFQTADEQQVFVSRRSASCCLVLVVLVRGEEGAGGGCVVGG